VNANGEPNFVYVYQYALDPSTERLVAENVHRWEFDADVEVLSMVSNLSTVYMILKRPDHIFLEKVDLSPLLSDPDMSSENGALRILLDHRLDETQVTSVSYDSATQLSTITLPHDIDGTATSQYVMYGRGGSTNLKPGQKATITQTSSSPVTFTVKGDFTSDKVYVGRNYTATYRFSPFVLRRRDNTPVTEGRLQVQRLGINFGPSSYFDVKVTPQNRETLSKPFTGKQIGTSTAIIGDIPLFEGTHTVNVKANNQKCTIDVESDAPLPMNIISADWSGMFGNRIRGR